MRKRASYPRGVCPNGRRYAMKHQLNLLEKALAPWPRRQAPLLEVNCGNGAFLPFLWQCGFDVQGAEIDPALREKARAARVPGLEVFAAADDALPFDNDSFDWVILHIRTAESLEANVQEGARIAARGLMLTFWNKSSLPSLLWRSKKAWCDSATPYYRVWKHMNTLGIGRLGTLSTLLLPGCLWHDPWPAAAPGSLGAWCIIRLDMGASRPGTPLPLRLNTTLSPSADTLLEYTQKSVRKS